MNSSKTAVSLNRILFSAMLVFGAQLLVVPAYAAEPALVKVTFSPAQPVQGDIISAFIELVSPFDSAQPVQEVLTANVNAGPDVALLHPSVNLWIAQLGPYNEIAKNTFSVSVDIQDMREAKALRQQITQLDIQIANLHTEIANTISDPNKLAELQAELQQAQSQRVQLVQALAATEKTVGTDQFCFFVEANTSTSSSFPQISSVSPNYGSVGGGGQVTISGQNFGTSPVVLIGGIQAAVVSSTSSQVTVTTPNFGTSYGVKNVEVRTATGLNYQNGILANGFYVLPSQVNLNPVATVSFPMAPVAIGSSVTITGTALVDSGLPQAQYNWQFIQVPVGSAIVPTGGIPSSASFTFDPDLVGTYILELTVSSGSLTSAPVFAVVSSYQPAMLLVNPTSALNFQTAPGTPQTISFTLQNISNVDTVTVNTLNVLDAANLSSNLFAPSDADGVAVPSPLSLVLTPFETITLNLTFTPSLSAPVGALSYNLNVIGSVTAGPDAGDAAGASSQIAANVVSNIQLAFITEPQNSLTSGAGFSPLPAVAFEDASGHVLTAVTGSVTFAGYQDSLCTTPVTQGTLSGTNSVSAVGGIATPTSFSYMGQAGTTIYIGASSSNPNLNACSTGVSIAAGPISQVIFVQQPPSTVGVGTQVTIQIGTADSYGNPIPQNQQLDLSYGCIVGGCGGVVGVGNAQPVNGIATFIIEFTQPGVFYLLAGGPSNLTETGSIQVTATARK